jgi:hypothetical protein
VVIIRFAPLQRNSWAVFSRSVLVAEITAHRGGQCTLETRRTLNLDEIQTVVEFMTAQESESTAA